MRCDQNQSKKLALRTFVGKKALAVILLFAFVTIGATSSASDFTNRIVSIQALDGSAIQISAEKEIGSRYTSYLLSKPPRVVFDFQGTDISSLLGVTPLSEHPVREIIVSQFESAGVQSGRAELILTEPVPYKVKVDGTVLYVDFTPAILAPASSLIPAVPVVDSVVAETVPAPAPAKGEKPEVPPVVVVSEKKIVSADSILEIINRKGEVFLRADGELDQCKPFALKSPARFVLDCFGVSEKIAKKTILLSGPIKSVRIGTYPDKVRFVLEGDGKTIDNLKMYPVADGLSLRYDGKSPSANLVAKTSPAVKAEKVKSAGLTVEKVDFKVVDGKSLVIVTLSAPGEVMQPIKDKTLVRFGVKGATIIPSLRRTIDASAFPSVIRQITPYIVSNRAQSDVRFAVELKGDTPYELKSDGNVVTLLVENGPFTKVQGPLDTTIELPLDSAGASPQKLSEPSRTSQGLPFKSSPEVITNETLKVAGEKKYTGQIVSLNFDNIEIRNVLLLIAEVSDTNIIANDDVKGVITLRLNNVPWDQALDVILESRGLGMEREGNILRIAPKEVMLKRKLDNAKIVTEISAIVVKETRAFSVNYGPVDDIAKKIKDQI
ncbi:MAG: AMIN domain-containing protein, partial [Anaerolineaceae bacterium]|nr:AMIN domain-containing protein [Anaerolineaceae bacterium]